jgi:hypothetical protein
MPAMDLLPKHIAIGAFSIGSELCRLLCRQVFVEIHSERQIQENIIGIDFGDWDCYVGGVEILDENIVPLGYQRWLGFTM